jgi:CubicO group peptidase (beta-lactamase class C family)
VLADGKAEQAGFKPEAVAEVEAVLEKWAKDSDQGFSVCLAKNGVVFFNKAYGQRGGRPMTVDDKSGVASITKMMAGTLMMELVDQGLVTLDDPAGKYLPSWRDIKVEKPVTIRDLYLHITGWHEGRFISDDLNDADEIVASYVPYFKPGSRVDYATTPYTMAGKMIENVGGESLPAFYKKHLIDPLGCTNWDSGNMGAGASVTAIDLARLGQMLLNHGAYGDQRFMSEETFEKMLPPAHVPEDEMDTRRGIGVRWYSIKGFGEHLIGHNSASESILRVDLDNKLVVVMCRNAAGANYEKYAKLFFEAVAQGLEKQSAAISP